MAWFVEENLGKDFYWAVPFANSCVKKPEKIYLVLFSIFEK